MSRIKALWLTLKEVVYQVVIVSNQSLNVVVCGVLAVILAAVTGKVQNPGYADETMSAHAWRADRDRKPWGRFWRPIIDVLFFWQRDEQGRRVKNHCERAYWKEIDRRHHPHEYREAALRGIAPTENRS